MLKTRLLILMITFTLAFSQAVLGQDNARDLANDYSSQNLAQLLSSKDIFPLSMKPDWDDEHPWVVEGQVLSRDGRPVPNCDLALIAQLHTMDSPTIPPIVVSESRSDQAGKFRITAPSLEWYQCRFLHLIVKKQGHAVAVRMLECVKKSHSELKVVLDTPQLVHGSLLRPDGKPLANVKLRFEFLSTVDNGTGQLGALGQRPAAWPADVTTDAKGEFTLDFVNSRHIARIGFVPKDQTLSPTRLFFSPDVANSESTVTCEPAKIVSGQVVCKDTGEPMANTWMIVVSLQNNFSRGADQQSRGVEVRTDEQGKFKARVRPGKFVTTYVYPAGGQPYPAWMEMQPFPDDEESILKSVQVPRGVLVVGKVVNESTGAPVAAAGVEYIPKFNFGNPKYPAIHNRYVDKETLFQVYWATERHRSLTDEQGRYQIAVLPGQGHLMVKAPTSEFISQPISRGDLIWGRPASSYYSVEGLREIDLRPSQSPVEISLVLQKGHEVTGTISGPNGEEIDKALLLSTAHSPLWINKANFRPQPILDGRWAVSGLDSAFRPSRISFFDREHEWGATVQLPQYDREDSDYDIRLMPCGSATVRLVDEKNKPWVNCSFIRGKQPLGMILVEGVSPTPFDPDFLAVGPDSIHWLMEELAYSKYRDLKTDKDGKIVFPCLIPGAQYVFYRFAAERRRFYTEGKAFRIEPGQNIDLGTIVARRQ